MYDQGGGKGDDFGGDGGKSGAVTDTTMAVSQQGSPGGVTHMAPHVESHAAPQQTRVPFGVNRWIYFAIIFVYVIFHGAIVMNWQPLREMLERSKAYSSRCSVGDALDDQGTCAAQRDAIARCATYGPIMMFVGAGAAGFVADRLGPKVAGGLGGLLFIISYLCLALANESRSQLFLTGFIIMGIAIETSFFGVISVPNLFPRYRNFMLALLGTARSLSMYYSLMMERMTTATFPMKNSMIVCLSISVFFTLLCLFMLPNRPYVKILPPGHEAAANARGWKAMFGKTPKNTKGQGDEGQGVKGLGEIENPQPLTAVSQSKTGAVAVTAREQNTKENLMEFAKAFKDPYLIAWMVCFSLLYSRGIFYPASLGDQHPDVTGPFGWVTPLSAIPCPFLGIASDFVGMMPVILFLNVCGTLMFICLISGTNMGAQWIALILSVFVLSFLASQCYVLIQEQYPETIRGKITGMCLLVAGLFAITNTPIYNWANEENNPKWKKADGLFLAYSGVSFICMAVMWYMRGTKPGQRNRMIKK